jgi:hypothetical protein
MGEKFADVLPPPTKERAMSSELIEVTQADRDFASRWACIPQDHTPMSQDAARHRLAAIATMQAREAELAEYLIDQRDEPFDETDRLHYWRDKAIKAARKLQGPSDAG